MAAAEGHGPAPYSVQNIKVVVASGDVQVREFTVAPDEAIPWHYHTRVTDWCYCLEGVVRAETRQTEGAAVSVQELAVGQSCRIDAGVIHRLTNGGTAACRYLLVQGGGRYDFHKL
ncbi:MAG TPA: cupin domain-containing protein [Burkholderiales bacterium]|nr:cupin domain-containing protein [Burkholderiales bacterium]